MSDNSNQEILRILESVIHFKHKQLYKHNNLLQTAKQQEKQVMHTIVKDENNHLNFFKSLYRWHTGRNVNIANVEHAETLSFFDALKLEMENPKATEKAYNILCKAYNNEAINNAINEIIHDEENHFNLCKQLLNLANKDLSLNNRTAQTVTSTYTVQPGDTLWLIDQMFNVTSNELLAVNPQITDLGMIYVGQVINIPISEATIKPQAGRESLTYLYGGTTASYLKNLDETKNSIRTVCPDYFDIDDAGNLLITYADKIDESFIQEMHRRGIKLTPFISNHWARPKGIAALNNRENLSNQIAENIAQYNLDGINIDIENVSEQYREAYTSFVSLVRQKVPNGKIVSVAVAANPNNLTIGWQGSYDYNALAQIADYLMIMGYDESYYGSEPGPISSSTFFERSIQYALNNGVPKEKIVMGIPFFGRYWKLGDELGGIGISTNDVQYLIDNYSASVTFDESSQSANAVVTIKPDDPKPQIGGGRILDAGIYNIWYDNLMSVRFKLNMINNYDLMGVGSWALGQENKAIWDFYSTVLNGGE